MVRDLQPSSTSSYPSTARPLRTSASTIPLDQRPIALVSPTAAHTTVSRLVRRRVISVGVVGVGVVAPSSSVVVVVPVGIVRVVVVVVLVLGIGVGVARGVRVGVRV
jgi:hypothetical protein